MTDIDKITARFQAEIARREALEAKMPRCAVCGAIMQQQGQCEACAEIKAQKYIEEQKEINRLGGIKAYKNFHISNYQNKEVLEFCKDYPNNNLFIFGSSGVGKTHLATAIIRQFTDAMIVKSYDIFSECRADLSVDNENAIIRKYVSCRYLLIDDLGAEKATDYSISTLYKIMEKWDMNERKGLIVTSNYSPSELADFLKHERIVSRILGFSNVVRINGKDMRISRGNK